MEFSIFNFLTLLCGLALFLYGMQVMSDGLKKSAGNQLKSILGKMTKSPILGFLLGLVVTAIVQSSSATTVMVVGFVNSAAMTLSESVSVIVGANVGAVSTYWITALSTLGNTGTAALQWLKPESWMPILAIIGVGITMFVKRGKKRDLAMILIGFSVLMVGMELMSDSMSGLKDNPAFVELLTYFEHPLFGIVVGTLITALVQSSAASVGILQTLSLTGKISFGVAIPIMLGQNIGTCITALLSSIGASKNGKRAALIHLYYNIASSFLLLALHCLCDGIFDFAFADTAIDAFGIAGTHTVLKLIGVLIMLPLTSFVQKAATLTVREEENHEVPVQAQLDERLFRTPAAAVIRATGVTAQMAKIVTAAYQKALRLQSDFDPKKAEEVRALEEKADLYEDALGTYLVELSGCDLGETDGKEVTKLLHLIGDFERISDHAVNLVESAEEMAEKKVVFSAEATKEVTLLHTAVGECLELATHAFLYNDLATAVEVEPLEEVIDGLCEKIKKHHILRLQKSECTIEHGFVLSDILTNDERVADHCSNIAGCVIEISAHNGLAMHEYLDGVRASDKVFREKYEEYAKKYPLAD